MRVARPWFNVLIRVCLAGWLAPLSAASDKNPAPLAEKVISDNFETPQPVWEREHTDTTINLIAQERSVRAAHDGNLSERFEFQAGAGSQFFASYTVPKISVDDSLEIGLWVRANRGGIQLYARVVLPADVDPETKAPSFVLVPGTVYDRVDRWQRLELAHMLPSIERQARVLRASTKRPVSLTGAYLERIVVNLLGGPGASEVFLDDLSISPVSDEILARWAKPASVGAAKEKDAAGPRKRPAPGRIKLDGHRLRRVGDDKEVRDWFPTAIAAPGADVVELRRFGFDVLADDGQADGEHIKKAIDWGFLLMPRLNGLASEEGADGVLDQARSYPYPESVAFWQLADTLGRKRDFKSREDERDRVRKVLSGLRGLQGTSRLVLGTIDGALPLFARPPSNLSIIGIEPLLWASAQEPLEGLHYLRQRRWLTTLWNAGGLYWAWLPASASKVVRENIWGEESSPAWGNPQMQPDQLRLLTYMALSAGYRGIGYKGDADLTRPAGRALLIELGLLNEEIDLCETFLARGSDPTFYDAFFPDPPVIPNPGTSNSYRVIPKPESGARPGLKVAAINISRKGALLIVTDFASMAQYQSPQMAYHDVMLRVMLPAGAQAFEISPGEVKVLDRDRVPEGTQLTLPDFGGTALILCTTDLALAERLQQAILKARPVAVQLAIEQAELMLQSVTEINGRLAADGQQILTPADLKRRADAGMTAPPHFERDLLAKADASIKAAREAQEREDLALAWSEARRAQRPLRILMRGHFDKASWALATALNLTKFDQDSLPQTSTKARKIPLLIRPISCPPMTTFNTLPELYLWLDWIGGKQGYRFGKNRVPSGSFDDPEEMTKAGWVNLGHQLDGITSKIDTDRRAGANAGSEDVNPDDRVIRLRVKPTKADGLDLLPPAIDFPAAAIRSPGIEVKAKNLIRISVQVKRSVASEPGMGGIIVRDSIGGEQFQFRSSAPIPSFSRVVLYRKAPKDGIFTVTLGLAGYGEAYFDDLRVEMVEEEPSLEEPRPIVRRAPSRDLRQPRLPDTGLPATAEGRTGTRPPIR